MANRKVKMDKLVEDARAQGAKARAEGRPRASPFRDYPAKALKEAWEQGYDSAAPRIETQEPQVKTQEPKISTPGVKWPDGQPLPEKYTKPQPLPCPNCKLVRTERGDQAVLVLTTSSSQSVAYLWCRACEHRFKLPIDAGKQDA